MIQVHSDTFANGEIIMRKPQCQENNYVRMSLNRNRQEQVISKNHEKKPSIFGLKPFQKFRAKAVIICFIASKAKGISQMLVIPVGYSIAWHVH